MKPIKKIYAWITSGVLAVVSIVFISLFVVQYNQRKDYHDIIVKNIGDLKNNIKIKIDAIEDTQDREFEYKNVLALRNDNKLKTLQDLLETKKEDFKLGKQTNFGKMVEEIKGKSKWIQAIYSKGSWWKISSLDYVAKYPDKKGKGPQASETGDLNVGIQGVYLTSDFTFTFTQVEVNASSS